MKHRRTGEYDYYGYFAVCAQMALEEARYLEGVLRAYERAAIQKNMEAMHRIENEADQKKHEMLERLAHEFMTPIEREDIMELAQQLDNVVDAIEEVMRRLYMYDIASLRPNTLALSSLIVRCCESLLGVIAEFPHFKRSKTIHAKIIEVNAIESEGDRLHAEGMRALFTDGTELREVVIWMTLYECLEDCLDACEDAADIIEGVIMKNT